MYNTFDIFTWNKKSIGKHARSTSFRKIRTNMSESAGNFPGFLSPRRAIVPQYAYKYDRKTIYSKFPFRRIYIRREKQRRSGANRARFIRPEAFRESRKIFPRSCLKKGWGIRHPKKGLNFKSVNRLGEGGPSPLARWSCDTRVGFVVLKVTRVRVFAQDDIAFRNRMLFLYVGMLF